MLRTVHSLLRLMSGGRILCVVETPTVIRRVQLWQVKLTGLDIRVSRLQLITEKAARCTGRDTVVIAHLHFSFLNLPSPISSSLVFGLYNVCHSSSGQSFVFFAVMVHSQKQRESQ